MTEVTQLYLVPRTVEVYESVIETLEGALEQAHEGGVVAVAVAIVRPSGGANCAFSESDQGPALLGAIEIVRTRILRAMDEIGEI